MDRDDATAVAVPQGGTAVDESEAVPTPGRAAGGIGQPVAGTQAPGAVAPMVGEPEVPVELTPDEVIERRIAAAVDKKTAEWETKLSRAEQERRLLQAQKDQEVAAQQARTYQAEQAYAAQQAQMQAFVAQQQATYQQQLAEWWQSATPEEKTEYQAQLIRDNYTAMQEQNRLQGMAWQLVQQGVPANELDLTSEEGLKYSYQRYLDNLQRRRDELSPYGETLKKWAQWQAMTPAQKAAVRAWAAAKKAATAPAAPLVAPPVAPELPAPDDLANIVTPGSTSGAPLPNVHTQIMKLLDRGGPENIRKAKELMRQSKGSKIDKTTE